MKKLIFITLISFITTISLSQPVFEKIFENTSRVYDMILTSDNSLLIYGFDENDGIILIKTNLVGEILWQKNYDCQSQYSLEYQLIESQTGFYYIVGSHSYKPMLLKLDIDGENVWSKEWAANPEYPCKLTTIKQISVNCFLVSGETDNSQTYPPSAWTMKIDTLGNSLCENYGFGESTIHQTLLAGNEYFALSSHWQTSEIILNQHGATCSNISYDVFNYGNGSGDLISGNINSFYLGSKRLIKTDYSGNEIWNIDLYPEISNNYIKSIILSNNFIISTGYFYTNSNMHQFFISICDTAGFINNLYNEQSYYSEEGKKIIKVGDDIYIVGNLRMEEPPAWDWDFFLRKYSFDSLITSIGSNNAVQGRTINVFPNPATSCISIAVPSYLPIEEAIIYNRLGQKALVAVPVNNTVDVSELTPGIYFLEVITSDSRAGTKLVVE